MIPEVREALLAAADRRAQSRWRLRRPVGWLARVGDALPIAVTIAGTLTIAAIAILALRGSTPTSHSESSPRGTSLAAIRSRLAVLRRPQTDADRRGSALLGQGSIPRFGILPAQTRLALVATSPAGGRVRVYLFVRRVPNRQSGAVKRPAALALVAVAVDARDRIIAQVPGATLDDPSLVGSDPHGALYPAAAGSLSIGIVPDGVARVSWKFSNAGYGILRPHPPVTTAPTVEHNIAITPRNTTGPLLSAAWYDSAGHRIAARGASERARVQLRLIAEVNASRRRPISSVLLEHYSLFRDVPADDLSRDRSFPPLAVGNAGLGLNYWQTRYVSTVTGLDGRGLWIIPGTHGLCITDPQAGTCGRVNGKQAARGIIVGTTGGGPGGRETITGLVPDGNTTVTIETADGSRSTVPVVAHNVYEATVHGRITAILSRDSNGRIHRTPI